MKYNKKVFILLGVLIAVLLIVAIVYQNRDRRTYELNLPQVEDLSKIELKRNEMSVGIYKTENSKRNPENVTIEVIKDTITNKTAEITVYASKENIEKLKQNRTKRYELTIENELNQVNNENARLERMLKEMEDKITDKESRIENYNISCKKANIFYSNF